MTLRLLRASLGLLVTALQVALALYLLGPPDPRAAAAFLTGSVPTAEQSIAILELLLWAVFGVASAVAIAATVREAWQAVPRAAIRRGWGVAVVLCGMAILLAGAARQLAPPSVGLQGGGTVTQAMQALGR